VQERPAGLVYRPDLLTRDEETRLLDVFEVMDFESVVMHGRAARRSVRHFGVVYDFDTWRIRSAEPVPVYLHDTRDRTAALAGLPAEEFQQALVTRYPPGATIGWHRDAAAFGRVVAGVSLGGACVMRFQRRASGGERRVYEQPLEPRSAYLLAGAARFAWQHSIPAVVETRYSVTFRSLRPTTGNEGI